MKWACLLLFVVIQTLGYLASSSKVVSALPTATKSIGDAQIKVVKKKKNGVFAKVGPSGDYYLTYYGLMFAGAVARSVSATAVHPLNIIKTILQKKGGTIPPFSWHVYSRGAGSQFIMSIPHGALNFAVTETTKTQLALLSANSTLARIVPVKLLNPLLDFLSSAISTFICSIVSTPQMVITDRIMAGIYTDFLSAIAALYKTEGIAGFYLGWLPALVQKIPSYALTWMFFQQFKTAFSTWVGRAGTALENLLLGSFAAAGACCVMIPVDTIKTRIVTQGRSGAHRQYTGMMHCLETILSEEGVGSLYRALPPRLLSVVPMIGIQFAVYELVKRLLMQEPPPKLKLKRLKAMAREMKGQMQQALGVQQTGKGKGGNKKSITAGGDKGKDKATNK